MIPGLEGADIERILAVRHELHMHPELSDHEYRTSSLIRDFLAGLPQVSFIDLPVDTGVAARITGLSDAEVMLRADIDALPQTEKTDVPWKSEVPGIMHACGHDVHTAALLGAALMLSREAAAGRLERTVDLLFQPAEEGTTGARKLIDAGLFDHIHPEECYGIHNWPSLETGTAAVEQGARMSAKRNMDIIIYGRGGHGSMPHLNTDPIVCAAAVISSLQTVISRNVDPLDAAILSINMIEGGSPMNLVVDKVLIKATIRSLSDAALDRMTERVRAIVSSTADAYECRSEIIWKERIPAVLNSQEMTEKALVIAETAGLKITGARPSLASEDFALYGEYVPSFFFWVGSRTPGAEIHELHTPEFFADDETVIYAAGLYAACGASNH